MHPIIEWLPGQTLPEAFTSLPFSLYAGDPHWIPEAPADIDAAFSPGNPWFEGRQAAAWVMPGRARMAGFYDPQLRINGVSVACFGYWESINDAAPDAALFGRFEAWARERGARHMYGPINFNTFGKYRIRMNLRPGEGCFPGEPYNPPYYKDLLAACGYRPEADYISQHIPDEQVDPVYRAKEGLKADIARLPYQFRYLTADFWLSRLPDFYAAIDIIFGDNFAFTPITREQFQQFYGPDYAKKLCPKLSVVVLNEREEIIGFSLGFPDYAPLCNQGADPRIPYRDIAYETHFPLLESPTFLLRTVGVLPGYRHQDIMNAMGIYAMFNFRKYYRHSMACLMKAENFSTRFFSDVPHIRREYSLFGKAC
jgi:hypothetical protein